MQTNFVYKVYQIYKQNKFNNDLLLALSSGQDSIALYLVLVNIQKLISKDLTILHCNHFVQINNFIFINEIFKLAFLFNNPLLISSPTKHVNTETHSQSWRHRIIRRSLEKIKVSDIYLAHTKTDKIETILLNLMRGSGLTGLTKFENKTIFKKPSFFNSSISTRKLARIDCRNYIYNRPLTFYSRKQIQILCNQNKLPNSIDQTNLNLSHKRNRIRLLLIPFIKFYFDKNIETQINDLSNILNNDFNYINGNTDKIIIFLQKDIKNSKFIFKKLPKSMQYNVLKKLLLIYSNKKVRLNLLDELLKLI